MAGQSPCQRKLTHPLGEREEHLLMAAGCQKCFCVTFDKSNKTPARAGWIGWDRKGWECL